MVQAESTLHFPKEVQKLVDLVCDEAFFGGIARQIAVTTLRKKAAAGAGGDSSHEDLVKTVGEALDKETNALELRVGCVVLGVFASETSSHAEHIAKRLESESPEGLGSSIIYEKVSGILPKGTTPSSAASRRSSLKGGADKSKRKSVMFKDDEADAVVVNTYSSNATEEDPWYRHNSDSDESNLSNDPYVEGQSMEIQTNTAANTMAAAVDSNGRDQEEGSVSPSNSYEFNVRSFAKERSASPERSVSPQRSAVEIELEEKKKRLAELHEKRKKLEELKRLKAEKKKKKGSGSESSSKATSSSASSKSSSKSSSQRESPDIEKMKIVDLREMVTLGPDGLRVHSEDDAARIIQANVRGHLARQNSLRRRLSEGKAAGVIQRLYRGYSARKLVDEIKADTPRSDRLEPIQNESPVDETAEEESAAVAIQSQFRKHKAMKEVEEIKKQREEEEGAAVAIQSQFRKHKAVKEVEEIKKQREEEEGAAVAIQSQFRKHKAVKEVEEIKKQREEEEGAAVAIQSQFRKHKAVKEVEEIKKQREEEESAAVAIQSQFRRHKAAQEVQALKRDVSDGDTSTVDQEEEEAAVKIQNQFRKHQAGKELEKRRKLSNAAAKGSTNYEDESGGDESDEEKAAVAIQSQFRKHKAMKEVENLKKQSGSRQKEKIQSPSNRGQRSLGVKAGSRSRVDWDAGDSSEEERGRSRHRRTNTAGASPKAKDRLKRKSSSDGSIPTSEPLSPKDHKLFAGVKTGRHRFSDDEDDGLDVSELPAGVATGGKPPKDEPMKAEGDGIMEIGSILFGEDENAHKDTVDTETAKPKSSVKAEEMDAPKVDKEDKSAIGSIMFGDDDQADEPATIEARVERTSSEDSVESSDDEQDAATGKVRIHIVKGRGLLGDSCAIRMRAGKLSHSTKPADWTADPTWDEFFELDLDELDRTTINLELRDGLTPGTEDYLGSAGVSFNRLAKAGEAGGWFSLWDEYDQQKSVGKVFIRCESIVEKSPSPSSDEALSAASETASSEEESSGVSSEEEEYKNPDGASDADVERTQMQLNLLKKRQELEARMKERKETKDEMVRRRSGSMADGSKTDISKAPRRSTMSGSPKEVAEVTAAKQADEESSAAARRARLVEELERKKQLLESNRKKLEDRVAETLGTTNAPKENTRAAPVLSAQEERTKALREELEAKRAALLAARKAQTPPSSAEGSDDEGRQALRNELEKKRAALLEKRKAVEERRAQLGASDSDIRTETTVSSAEAVRRQALRDELEKKRKALMEHQQKRAAEPVPRVMSKDADSQDMSVIARRNAEEKKRVAIASAVETIASPVDNFEKPEPQSTVKEREKFLQAEIERRKQVEATKTKREEEEKAKVESIDRERQAEIRRREKLRLHAREKLGSLASSSSSSTTLGRDTTGSTAVSVVSGVSRLTDTSELRIVGGEESMPEYQVGDTVEVNFKEQWRQAKVLRVSRRTVTVGEMAGLTPNISEVFLRTGNTIRAPKEPLAHKQVSGLSTGEFLVGDEVGVHFNGAWRKATIVKSSAQTVTIGSIEGCAPSLVEVYFKSSAALSAYYKPDPKSEEVLRQERASRVRMGGKEVITPRTERAEEKATMIAELLEKKKRLQEALQRERAQNKQAGRQPSKRSNLIEEEYDSGSGDSDSSDEGHRDGATRSVPANKQLSLNKRVLTERLAQKKKQLEVARKMKKDVGALYVKDGLKAKQKELARKEQSVKSKSASRRRDELLVLRQKMELERLRVAAAMGDTDSETMYQIFEDAATKIQTAYRGLRDRSKTAGLREAARLEVETAITEMSAIAIQSAWRGFKDRNEVARRREELENIERDMFAMLEQDRINNEIEEDLPPESDEEEPEKGDDLDVIEDIYEDPEAVHDETVVEEPPWYQNILNSNAKVIQAAYRDYRERRSRRLSSPKVEEEIKEEDHLNQSVEDAEDDLLNSIFRFMEVKSDEHSPDQSEVPDWYRSVQEDHAARSIQVSFRYYKSRKRPQSQQKVLVSPSSQEAATIIQRRWRGYFVRRRLTYLHTKLRREKYERSRARAKQRKRERMAAKRAPSSEYNYTPGHRYKPDRVTIERRHQRRSAIIIQKIWRGYISRKRVKWMMANLDKARRERRVQYYKKKVTQRSDAAVMIQSLFRGHRTRRWLRLDKERLRLQQQNRRHRDSRRMMIKCGPAVQAWGEGTQPPSRDASPVPRGTPPRRVSPPRVPSPVQIQSQEPRPKRPLSPAFDAVSHTIQPAQNKQAHPHRSIDHKPLYQSSLDNFNPFAMMNHFGGIHQRAMGGATMNGIPSPDPHLIAAALNQGLVHGGIQQQAMGRGHTPVAQMNGGSWQSSVPGPDPHRGVPSLAAAHPHLMAPMGRGHMPVAQMNGGSWQSSVPGPDPQQSHSTLPGQLSARSAQGSAPAMIHVGLQGSSNSLGGDEGDKMNLFPSTQYWAKVEETERLLWLYNDDADKLRLHKKYQRLREQRRNLGREIALQRKAANHYGRVIKDKIFYAWAKATEQERKSKPFYQYKNKRARATSPKLTNKPVPYPSSAWGNRPPVTTAWTDTELDDKPPKLVDTGVGDFIVSVDSEAILDPEDRESVDQNDDQIPASSGSKDSSTDPVLGDRLVELPSNSASVDSTSSHGWRQRQEDALAKQREAKLEKERERFMMRQNSAINIQRMYRGHTARAATQRVRETRAMQERLRQEREAREREIARQKREMEVERTRIQEEVEREKRLLQEERDRLLEEQAKRNKLREDLLRQEAEEARLQREAIRVEKEKLMAEREQMELDRIQKTVSSEVVGPAVAENPVSEVEPPRNRSERVQRAHEGATTDGRWALLDKYEHAFPSVEAARQWRDERDREIDKRSGRAPTQEKTDGDDAALPAIGKSRPKTAPSQRPGSVPPLRTDPDYYLFAPENEEAESARDVRLDTGRFKGEGWVQKRKQELMKALDRSMDDMYLPAPSKVSRKAKKASRKALPLTERPKWNQSIPPEHVVKRVNATKFYHQGGPPGSTLSSGSRSTASTAVPPLALGDIKKKRKKVRKAGSKRANRITSESLPSIDGSKGSLFKATTTSGEEVRNFIAEHFPKAK